MVRTTSRDGEGIEHALFRPASSGLMTQAPPGQIGGYDPRDERLGDAGKHGAIDLSHPPFRAHAAKEAGDDE